MTMSKIAAAAVLAVAIGAPVAGYVGYLNGEEPMTSLGIGVPFLHGFLAEESLGSSALASLAGADAWLNSPPLTASDLRGKVILVDFWTYTCINWLRTLPYIRAWDAKYRDKGLVVIGVHAPEFSFEKDLDNVRRAVTERQITYPVAVDSGHAIWSAFENQYWPALYFIDAEGRVRHRYFGEGDYRQSEMVIRELLTEAGADKLGDDSATVPTRDIEASADWDNLRSPENYVGYARTENFVSPGGMIFDEKHSYQLPSRLRLNQWALSGDWTARSEGITVTSAGGSIAYSFHARDLHLVMGPAVRGKPVRFRVRIDGKPPGAAHGLDVDDTGAGTVTDQRLYQLIRQSNPIVDRQFEIEFLDSGVDVFAFTFG